jgi:Domain of unknown function (DUF4260)
MKNIIRIEEGVQLALAVYLFGHLPFAWWSYVALFIAPDISMLGYIFGPAIGAYCYNIFHHKGIAILMYLAGAYTSSDVMMFVGLLLFGHSAFDRMLGYGLKYTDSFKHTHLGWIGNSDHQKHTNK